MMAFVHVNRFGFFLWLLLIACSNSTNRSDRVYPLSAPWERAIAFQQPPEGLDDLSASSCGECHQEIFAEWKASNHALAFQDLQFQAEWAKDDSLWLCLNCHTPLQNQQPFLITGKYGNDPLKPVKKVNPDYDSRLQHEGITCAVCHVRDGAVIGVGEPSEEAPHAIHPELRMDVAVCLQCHNVSARVTPTLVCQFQTGDEWQAGPYDDSGQDCITCHMPVVYRSPTFASKPRWMRRHTWVGSPIPKIQGPSQMVEGYIRGLDIEVYLPPQSGHEDSLFVTLRLRNSRAGHDLPTGDPEYFITIDLVFFNRNQQVLQDTTFRIGQQWQWWPRAQKLADNRLKPLEERAHFVGIPSSSSEAAYLEVTATFHRMTEANARAAGLSGIYPIRTVIYHKRFDLADTTN